MSDVVVIIPLSPIPEFPSLAYRALGTYNSMAYNWAKHIREMLQPQLNAMAAAIQANALLCEATAGGAVTAAITATTQADLAMGYRNAAGLYAGTATTKAAEAEASAIAASKLNLGDKAAPPATDNQGGVLRAGATYYDTTLSKWRVWNGAAWGDGISAVAGVSSFNSRTGAINDGVVLTIPAGSVDLNTIVASGFYSFGTVTNGPAAVADSQLIVSREGDTLTQIVVDKLTGAMFVRAASALSTAAVWSAWQRMAQHSPAAVPLAGGSIDCSKGNYFTETVAAARTLSFSNIPAGSYACVVEVLHTSGAITMPSGTVWPNNSAPTLVAGKRQLLFFQRAQSGTAGWFASVLPSFTS